MRNYYETSAYGVKTLAVRKADSEEDILAETVRRNRRRENEKRARDRAERLEEGSW